MIYFIGNAPPNTKNYRHAHSDQFISWLREQKGYQLDIETNVTEHWCTKELRTIQFGDLEGKNQWVIQWSSLNELGQMGIRKVLEWPHKIKVIHNAAFECIVLLFHGIRLRNVYDTMLAEMVLHCGMHAQDDDDLEMNETDIAGGYYSLTQTNYRYLGKFMDKSEQMNFGDDILTESKIIYAATDVMNLGLIRKWQMSELVDQDLDWVAALEMEAVLGYSEMTYHGMELDVDQWLAQLELAIPIQAAAKEKLDLELIDPNGLFVKRATDMGFYHPKDKLTINWASPKQKAEIVERFFPFLVGRCGKPALKKLQQQVNLLDELMYWVNIFAEEDWEKIEESMLETDRQWLIDKEYLTPAGSVTINWGSWQQTLPIFQCFMPKLKSTSAKGAGGMGNFYHPIGTLFKEWKDAKKLSTTYGQEFIDKHLEPDGKIRTTFNQIVSTGRVSSRKPNMQQIPVRDPIGARYRNCFLAPKGWGYVSSDYMQQELVIIATISDERVWKEALKKRQDLHSLCAELVFKKDWEKAAEKGCAYYQTDEWSEQGQKWKSEVDMKWEIHNDWKSQPRRLKCKCKGHKKWREPVKNLDFGMAYGLSKYKFAGDMRWEIKRAEGVINDYFRTFPSLGKWLTYLGHMGVLHGVSTTMAPFFRKRWFPDWELHKSGIEAHIKDIKYDHELGKIERASKNHPIQGTAADMCKLSMVLIYWELHDGDEDLSDKVHLVCQVHDQNDTVADDDYADTWMPVMDRVMHKAALFIIPNGLLRAETSRNPVWSK